MEKSLRLFGINSLLHRSLYFLVRDEFKLAQYLDSTSERRQMKNVADFTVLISRYTKGSPVK